MKSDMYTTINGVEFKISEMRTWPKNLTNDNWYWARLYDEAGREWTVKCSDLELHEKQELTCGR